MHQNDTILFDLDGTLTDSAEAIGRSMRYAVMEMGGSIPDSMDLRAFMGPPLIQSLAHFVGPDKAEAARALYLKRYVDQGKGVLETTVYPGIYDMLRGLKKAGKHLFVATAKAEHAARDVLIHFQMDAFFDAICGSTLDATRPDKTAVIRHLCTAHNLSRPGCVMVGDRHHDIHGAKDNALAAIGVTWGYGSAQELRDAGADLLVSSAKDLLTVLTTPPADPARGS